jgi:translation elongation factor EF-Ts
LITSYIHHNGKVGVMVEINCETDFVARTDDFKQLGKEIALHIASAAPIAVDRDGIPEDTVACRAPHCRRASQGERKARRDRDEDRRRKGQRFFADNTLLEQGWIREPNKKVGDLIKEASGERSARTFRFAASYVTRWARNNLLAPPVAYTRVLLKVSGEALAGGHGTDFILTPSTELPTISSRSSIWESASAS